MEEESGAEETLRETATCGTIVGVGASAGGLEVFRRLLADLPGDTGFALVFIQHLDPNHNSMLADILGRATAMPVSEACDGMPVEANHVYVITPNVDLTVASGALKLTPRTQSPGSHMPIDCFLRSLASQCGSRAIGVVLSGTASDGSAGLQAIKAAGGVTFAQDPATAKFAGMPQAAIATGCVDFILPPEDIAQELIRIGRHPYIAEASPEVANVSPAPFPQTAPEEQKQEQKQFGLILAILHGAGGIDFSQYRAKMVKRRILRRLALLNIDGLANYTVRLQNDAAEIAALQRDLLIGVTSFFRDPEMFECLRKVVFPRITAGKPATDTIRIWVAGCATGEEAFSIAIALQEYMNEAGASWPIQIFASDISSAAIEKARTGKYFENIAADLTHERLNRHFTKVEGGYQIDKKLREMCVFTRHNLIEDPPFSKVDLVSCRNVLIYLGSVQKHIIALFHYALRRDGFLLLGASEAAASEDLFSVADGEHRIYARRETSRRPSLFSTGASGSRAARRSGSATSERAVSQTWEALDTQKQVDRILLSRYGPASVVVDEDLDVIEIRGKATQYLTLPTGKMSFNLTKLIPDPELFLEVDKLIQQARKSGEPVRQERVPHEREGSTGDLNIEVVPLDSDRKRALLVLFEPVPGAAAGAAESAGIPPEEDARDARIRRLKQQLADATQRYVSAIEEHQSSREESQNSAEEAISASEEMQSLNEELETRKEELQSVNEELITVNDELQARNVALAQARDFALSIVETVRQPLLVLDTELRIKMANHAFYRTFRTSPVEAEGQLIFLLGRGSWDLSALRNALDGLLQSGNPFPALEIEQDFPGAGHKNLVLAGSHINQLKMILLAVDDVTERKAAEHALRKSEDHLRQSQKMEAVGRLAGGIAHDFNNLLTTVIGYSSLLYDSVAGEDSARQQVLEIRAAAEKAAALTEQLLAFSRRKILQPKVLDLNGIVEDFVRMMDRLIDKRIKVTVNCDPALWPVRADAGEIGRVLMNLALNARDAMPDGGALTIATANATLMQADGANQEAVPGRYVTITVQNTGIGMGEDVRSHIFEPFFTTKSIGEGTGLGLATVLGIVEQSDGVIRCESEPDRGTTFTIFLPAVAAAIDIGPHPDGNLAMAPEGSEVILLIDDEDSVRVLVTTILKAKGYTILEARSGPEGLALCESYSGRVDLLVSDLMMPELAGAELADRALQLRPDMKVLFMSGHTEDAAFKEGLRKGTAFLQKPFAPAALARKVRETLDFKTAAAGQT